MSQGAKRVDAMHLGVFAVASGNHIAGWRHPGAFKQGADLDAFVSIAQAAERGKMDMFFIADGVTCSTDAHPGFMSQLEPMTTLAAVSTATAHIGLVATASTTFSEPYNLARAFSSLDHISGGRAGWNIVTSSDPDSETNFSGRTLHHDDRYRRAEEFVEVALALWDSWERDAIIADVDSGIYVDKSKVHTIDHHGGFFGVAGPLNVARCPQGRPVLVQAGSSRTGQEFATRYAEVLFTVQQDVSVAHQFYADVKQRVAEHGRNPAHCSILPGLTTVVGDTEQAAQQKLEQLAAYVDEQSAMWTMSARLGHDLSHYPLDGPIPELPDSDQIQGYARMILTGDYRKNRTLRDLYNLFAVSRGYLIFCGTPEQVATSMQEWFEAPACDGFNLTPAHFPGSLDDFVDHVVPELQKRGLFREEYTGSTLRHHFGLPELVNRHQH